MSIVFQSDPEESPGTHLLCIGVGHYPWTSHGRSWERLVLTPRHELSAEELEDKQALPLWTNNVGQLSSPPHSAYAVADWFIANRRNLAQPLRTVQVLSSSRAPLERPATFIEQPGEAEMADIEDAYRRWRRLGNLHPDNILIFYFCGHGFLVDGTNTILLTRDFGKRGQAWDHAIDITQTSWNTLSCKARTQLWLVDACQAAASGLAAYGPQGRTLPPVSSNADIRSALASNPNSTRIFASAPEMNASGLPSRASRFSAALIDALNGHAAVREQSRWIINTGDLSQPINAILEAQTLRNGWPAQSCQHHGPGTGALLRLQDPPLLTVDLGCRPSSVLSQVQLRLQDANEEHSPLQRQAAPQRWTPTIAAGTWRYAAAPIGTEPPEKATTTMFDPRNLRLDLEWP